MSHDASQVRTALTWYQIVPMVIGRLTYSTAFRMLYPLLTFLAAGLDVDLRRASLLVTMQVGAALISPLGGLLADRRGERTTMLLGSSIFCVGALVCALARSFTPFLLGYGLIGISTALYQPAMQAYASAHTDYARRGRVLSLLELAWAGSALIGVTTMTRLTEANQSWSPAFWVLLGMGVLVLVWTLVGLPGNGSRHRSAPGVIHHALSSILQQSSVLATLALLVCVMAATEMILVVYAVWLETSFAATTEQLGLVFGLLGLVELGGSGGAALLVDRLGKRRAVLIGFTATALLLGLLPLSSGNWALFLPLFLLFGICFEFAIVATFPLLSGIIPTARGTVLALGMAAIGMGRIIGSLLATPLWQTYGFSGNGLLGAGLALLGVLVGWLLIREGE